MGCCPRKGKAPCSNLRSWPHKYLSRSALPYALRWMSSKRLRRKRTCLFVDNDDAVYLPKIRSLDPIIEPMLQSVPDPFDSYGPPQSEDQIFSILAPLSIMANAQSSSTSSPSTVTPERGSIEPLPPSSNSKVASWLPITGSSPASPTESSEWVPTSPEGQSSLSTWTRRHLDPLPSPPRKAESKLRSILSSIDESQSRLDNPDLTSTSDTTSHPASGRIEQGEDSPQQEWAFASVHSQYEDINDNDITPRNTYLFTSHLAPAAPSRSLPLTSNNDYVSDNAVRQIDAS